MKTILLLILGIISISTEIAFRIHNYRLDKLMEQEQRIYRKE